MPRFRGADKGIIADIQIVAHLTEIARHFVSIFKRVATFGTGRLDHFQPMLIRPRNKADITALCAPETRHGVGRNRLIGVADVRLAVGVADCGRNIIGLGHGPAPSGLDLRLQGDGSEDPAELKHGRRGIER